MFASNLAFEMTEEHIRQVFSAMGPLKAVRLIKDHKQRSKGYAYIQYATPDALERALELDQKTVHGRIINVARSRPPAATSVYVLGMAGWQKKSSSPVPVQVLRAATECCFANQAGHCLHPSRCEEALPRPPSLGRGHEERAREPPHQHRSSFK